MTNQPQTDDTKRPAVIRILPNQPGGEVVANIAAENALIGSIVRNTDLLADIGELQPADFANRRNAFLWHSLIAMDNAGRDVNHVTLPERYMQNTYAQKHDNLNDVTAHVAHCLQHATDERKTVRHYAESVMESAVRIRGIEAAGQMSAMLRDKTIPLGDVLAQTDALWHESTEVKNVTSPRAGDVFDDFIEYQERLRAGHERRIIETGIPDFDSWTGGLITNQITILGGYSGEGKTTYMLDLMLALAMTGEAVALFVDEQSTKDIMRKLIAKLVGIPANRMNQALSDNEFQNVRAARDRIQALPLYIFDSVYLQPSSIFRTVRKLERQHGLLAGVFVDGLYIMRDDIKQPAPWMEHPDLMEKLLDWIHDSGRFLVLTHQLAGENHKTARTPTAYDLRGQQIIVQRTESIFLIHRPYDAPDTTRLLCVKHREKGQLAGTHIPLHWHDASESYVDFQTVDDIPF